MIKPQTTLLIVFLSLAVCFSAGCSGSRKAAGESTGDVETLQAIEKKAWPLCSELPVKTEYDAFFADPEFAQRLMLAGKVSSSIEELEVSRMKFRETGDLVEIFPLLFYYQNRESLELALQPEIKHKLEFLRVVLNSFDAYKTNRTAFDAKEKDSVDRQWRSYFKAVEKAQSNGVGKWSPGEGVDVLLEGVNASVLYDLPRAIRNGVGAKPANVGELQKDFEVSQSIYPRAESAAKSDIVAYFRGSQRDDAEKLFGNGSEYVKFSRQKAWEMGVGGGPLGVLEEQPHLPHNAFSTKYFPAALMKRGICR